MQALMSFENAPPFAAPLRFFLTGPLFAALAGLLIAWDGADIFASRWMPATLAVIHLLTVGFMLQVMLGALIQILPVVAGANLAQPLRLARWVHGGLTLGVLLLAGGLYVRHPLLLQVAVGVLLPTVTLFLAATVAALAGVPSTSPTIRGLKLALGGLAGVVVLGSVLALALAGGWGLPLALTLPALTDLHAAWGFGAWVGVLLVSFAFVVVPMFQLTPAYPARPSWLFSWIVLALVGVWSIAAPAGWPLVERGAQALLGVLGIAFAGFTLRLQAQRRRARPDPTYRYWQFGLIAGILALAMLSTAAIAPVLAEWPAWTPTLAVLLVTGGLMALIIGMIYKIVPFLAWLHLQNRGQMKVVAPTVNKLLADAEMLRQFKAHGVAVGGLLLACLWPALFARPAGLAFAVANGWLAFNLIRVARRYRDHAQAIDAKLAAR